MAEMEASASLTEAEVTQHDAGGHGELLTCFFFFFSVFLCSCYLCLMNKPSPLLLCDSFIYFFCSCVYLAYCEI